MNSPRRFEKSIHFVGACSIWHWSGLWGACCWPWANSEQGIRIYRKWGPTVEYRASITRLNQTWGLILLFQSTKFGWRLKLPCDLENCHVVQCSVVFIDDIRCKTTAQASAFSKEYITGIRFLYCDTLQLKEDCVDACELLHLKLLLNALEMGWSRSAQNKGIDSFRRQSIASVTRHNPQQAFTKGKRPESSEAI